MKENILKLDKPAGNFFEAYPWGNGSLGSMVYGSYPDEIIQLNHEDLWSGPPFPEQVKNWCNFLTLVSRASLAKRPLLG